MFFAYLDNTLSLGDASRLQDGAGGTANFILARGLGATQIILPPSGACRWGERTFAAINAPNLGGGR